MKHLLFSLLFVLLSCTKESPPASHLQVAIHSTEHGTKTEFPSQRTLNQFQKSKKGNTTSLVSWNIRDFGGSKEENEIEQIAQIIREYDLVAIQEVVAKDPKGAQAVARLADALNRMGSKWDYRVSDPTQSPSVYKSERYAFLWKTARVKLRNAPYLDTELAAVCDREPYIGLFKAENGDTPFYLVNFHSRRYNDQPEEEIKHFIKYPERLQSNRVIIAGDFNLDERHSVWDDFYALGFKNALDNTPSTLKTGCKHGVYTNHAIDNVYSAKGITILNSAAIDFVKHCDALINARLLSDHLPVAVTFQ